MKRLCTPSRSRLIKNKLKNADRKQTTVEIGVYKRSRPMQHWIQAWRGIAHGTSSLNFLNACRKRRTAYYFNVRCSSRICTEKEGKRPCMGCVDRYRGKHVHIRICLSSAPLEQPRHPKAIVRGERNGEMIHDFAEYRD